jgi:Thiol:disulfide interchange protein DsbD, N-terminal
MKKIFVFAFILLFVTAAKAQLLHPIAWAFSAKKMSDKTYELHLTATIQTGWHLYSQGQPEDAVVNPTAFSFNNNPLLSLDGPVKEVGKLEKFHDAKLKISANQYSKVVDFVQVVKLKADIKTNISGSVEFQTCNDERCLPPKTENFLIQIR